MCTLHGKDISIRRALDSLMKTPEQREASFEKSEALRGIRDGLYGPYYVFQTGENFVNRVCNPHERTALDEVGASKDRPLRACVIEAINDDAAHRASEGDTEDWPWRENLEDLLDQNGDLEIGWHGGLLSLNEKFRRDQEVQRQQHLAHVRGLKIQEAARAAAELEAIK